MESAIDPRLVCPRTLNRRVPDGYVPAAPAFGHRASDGVDDIVMVTLGVQFEHAALKGRAYDFIRDLVDQVLLEGGAEHHDVTFYEDSRGFGHFMIVGYWLSSDSYQRWLGTAEVSAWWDSDDRLGDGVGFFRESQGPRLEQFETIYGYQDDLPGAGAVLGGISGEVNEHGYWGSMRERFPLSQTNWMEPSGALTVVTGDPRDGGRVTIRGHDNLTVIRSGQNWEEAGVEERDYYVNKLEPVLSEGMAFLQDNGTAVGCYSNRFARSVGPDGALLDETYNLGHWGSLSDLERWAESHPTHLRIFASYVSNYASYPSVRLYHEVSMSDARTQLYEYINCHPETGMMRDARS